jgi:hypothetical protein
MAFFLRSLPALMVYSLFFGCLALMRVLACDFAAANSSELAAAVDGPALLSSA